MPSFCYCPAGHRWESLAASGANLKCPECGASGSREGDAATSPGPTTSFEFQPPQTLPQLPPKLADFEILGELGRGGMGIVYKARQLSANRTVALKVIRKDRLQHEESVRRFRREAQAAARLRHPNIVHVFDSDHSGDTHYLVMEYVDGVTLERLVEHSGPLPVERACDFIRQAALGLQHAKERALVHRDIKPSNLMITPPWRADGPAKQEPSEGRAAAIGYQVKILDMGVARMLQLANPLTAESLSTLTQGGTVIGTADYVAPEQLEDPHGADIRADLYSLGCTFYFLLTGQVPFPGGSLISKLDSQRWKTPASIHQLRDEVPAGVTAVVQKLMAKRPADRFPTPAELARSIEQLARTRYTGASGASLIQPRRLLGHRDSVWSVAVSPDGRRALSGGRDCVPRLWEIAADAVPRELPRQAQEIRATAFASDLERFCTAAGVTIRIWDSAGQELRRLAGHSATVRAALFLGDGKRLASAGDDKTIRIWDLATGHEMQRLAHHAGAVTGLALVGGADQLISSSRDQTLRLWDLRSGQEKQTLIADGGAVLAVAACPKGSYAVSGHFDTTIRLWDLESAQETRRFVGHKQMVTAVALLPDGRRLLSASQDHTVRLWDLENGCEIACLEGHEGGVNCVAALPDGKKALSAGSDGVLCLWELPN